MPLGGELPDVAPQFPCSILNLFAADSAAKCAACRAGVRRSQVKQIANSLYFSLLARNSPGLNGITASGDQDTAQEMLLTAQNGIGRRERTEALGKQKEIPPERTLAAHVDLPQHVLLIWSRTERSFLIDRPKHLALPHCRETRRRRHGRSLQS